MYRSTYEGDISLVVGNNRLHRRTLRKDNTLLGYPIRVYVLFIYRCQIGHEGFSMNVNSLTGND